LAFHLSKLSGRLLVAADQEGCRPKENYGRSGHDVILGVLAILRARKSGCAGRNGLRL
jgi:hypothetical protein